MSFQFLPLISYTLSKLEVSNTMSKIIIVGAGPVGLWTAIQIKLYSPETDILMLEQYPEYQRKHVVSISEASLENAHNDPAFRALFPQLIGNVSTKKIEDTLKNHAKSLGINLQYEKVTSCSTLQEKHSDADMIIGADGAHSLIRHEMFKDQFNSKKNLQYVAEMKYEVKGKTRAFNYWTESYSPLLKSNHMVVEHVGKTNEHGNTPITLRFFIDKNTFESIKAANFKKPYLWSNKQDQEKIDSRLKQSMEIWLKERETVLNDTFIENSIKVSGLELGIYTSKEVVLEQDNKTWMLVGDAAFGVPYFRSLNNGLLCGSELAKQLADSLKNKHDHLPLKKYTQYVSNLASQENLIANLKGTSIDSGVSLLNIGRKLLCIDGLDGDRSDVSVGGRLMLMGTAVCATMCTMYAMYCRKTQQDSKKPEVIIPEKEKTEKTVQRALNS